MQSFLQQYWPLLLPAALGFLGVYLLLPRPGRSLPLLGALAGGAALLAAGFFVVRLPASIPESILFYAFAGVALLGGAMMITQKNPVHAALSFALVVLASCGLFLLQGAPFLFAATIIVYAGAIVVTFLFVIMLAQQAGLSDADQRSREPFLASLAGFLLMGTLLCVLEKNFSTSELDRLLAEVENVSRAKTTQEVKQLLGDPDLMPFGEKSLNLVTQLGAYFPETEKPLVDNLEEAWGKMDVALLAERCQKVIDAGRRLRLSTGILTPSQPRAGRREDAQLPLSPHSGVPANAEFQPTADGKIPERLAARNVAALGRSLFTDHLVAVELAGVLLLVATIGAIAIAGRRAEGLR
ncbi:MAG: NADH-quinone oxidoreductase subunit J [Gemmataceae bacterium]|nr:NADH-quinone oxidoreductase subunit J [Gemmataceae bacterium]MCI0740370.1 NADH-quinone oxidoreductase subunit J [Gemmataceae bacterium]